MNTTWISVDEKEPPINEEICVVVRHKYYEQLKPAESCMGKYDGNGKYLIFNMHGSYEEAVAAPGSDSKYVSELIVTHWTEFPDLPIDLDYKNERLLSAARRISNICDYEYCGDCILWDNYGGRCLVDGIPKNWELSGLDERLEEYGKAEMG